VIIVDEYEDEDDFFYPFPRTRFFLGISVVLSVVISILSQALVVSHLLNLPILAIIFEASMAIGVFFFALTNVLILVSIPRLQVWISVAMHSERSSTVDMFETENDELRTILTGALERSRVGIALPLFGSIIVLLTGLIPLFYPGGILSILQQLILIAALLLLVMDIVLEGYTARAITRYGKMSEPEIYEETRSSSSGIPELTEYNVDIQNTLGKPMGMNHVHIFYVLTFLWIGITDLLFLVQ
jgi:hypothetical protein